MSTLAKKQPVPALDQGAIPHGRVSLWAMINFSISSAQFQLWQLKNERDLAAEETLRKPNANPAPTTLASLYAPAPSVDRSTAQRLRAILDKGTRQTFACLEYDAINDRIDHLDAFLDWVIREPNFSLSWSELKHELNVIIQTIEHELGRHCFFHYKKEKAKLVTSFVEDWQKILDAFPDVRKDAFAATDLYGLEHDTASVFHSMRVAERGLRALGKERRVKLKKNRAFGMGRLAGNYH